MAKSNDPNPSNPPSYSKRQRLILSQLARLWTRRQSYSSWGIAKTIDDLMHTGTFTTHAAVTAAINGEGVRMSLNTVIDWQRAYSLFKAHRDESIPWRIFVAATKAAYERFTTENPEALPTTVAAMGQIFTNALRAIVGGATMRSVPDLVWDGANETTIRRRDAAKFSSHLLRLKNIILSASGGTRERYVKRMTRMIENLA